MSVVPSEIPEVGATSQRLRQNPRFDPLRAGFGTEEYFVWSRFDGATSVKDLILMTGLAIDRAVAIVRQLRRAGALLAPGETDAPIPRAPAAIVETASSRTTTASLGSPSSRAGTAPLGPGRATPAGARAPLAPPSSSSSSRTPTVPIRKTPPVGSALPVPGTPPRGGEGGRGAPPIAATPAPDPRRTTGPLATVGAPRPGGEAPTLRGLFAALPLPELDLPSAAERAMLGDPGDLSLEERTRVISGLRLVAAGDVWALVGVAPGTDKRVIKRAFFERSKLFHPDRFYGRDLGPWQARLHTVFEAISTAHAELMDPRLARREDTAATAPQSPTEYAAELFDRACQAEVSGDAAAAVRLFAAAVKLDPIARYLRRAASCALAAGEHLAALDHARKATALDPTDPSTARTLARILRALDRLDDAEEVLVMALAMKNENDNLGGELVADLGIVRAALRARG